MLDDEPVTANMVSASAELLDVVAARPADADTRLPLVPAFTRDPEATLDSPWTRQFHIVGRLAPASGLGVFLPGLVDWLDLQRQGSVGLRGIAAEALSAEEPQRLQRPGYIR